MATFTGGAFRPVNATTDNVIEGLEAEAQAEVHPEIFQRTWGLAARVDPTVTFEEFQYWARIERAEEQETNRLYVEERGPVTVSSVIKNRFSKGHIHDKKKREKELREKAIALTETTVPQRQSISAGVDEKDAAMVLDEKSGKVTPPGYDSGAEPMTVTEEEWRTAARALRTASWGTIFFLVTTDILGWSSAPFVFASVGYGTGVALYVIFGVFAGVGGWALWTVFMDLDSTRFPMASYGDPFFRVYGSWARHFMNVSQAIEQFLSVCILVLANGTTLAQITMEKLCFIVAMVICAVVGMIVGNIRSLQRLGWLCNASVWLNIVSFIIICVAAARFAPEYSATTQSTLIKTVGPVRTFAGFPPNEFQQQAYGFAGHFNGINEMVYAYAGSVLFVAFMAEMRHPFDFLKGLFMAQAFICFVYIFFGVFVYSFYGQYSASNINNVVTPYGLQTAGNVLALLTGLIACFLYFNIGMKTVYLEIFQELLHFPPIQSTKGKWLWSILGPLYWILAFVVAASVPNLSGIVSFVGGLFEINFTYSFPAILYVGYKVQVSAALPGEGFDPATGVTTRHDGGMTRWWRGFKKSWLVVTPVFIYALAGLAASGMGTWAAVEGLIAVFGPGGTVATSWGCAVPV